MEKELWGDIVKDLLDCRQAIKDLYLKAIKDKDEANYRSIDYIRAREKASALDDALLYFDMYTARYLSAGD